MTIKRKLLINMFLPIGTLLLIILVMISFHRHKDETERTNDIALSLLANVFELSQRTDAYLLLGENPARAEWYQIYHSVSALLDQLHFHDHDEKFILTRTRRNLGEMRDLFPAAINEGGRRHPASKGEASVERDKQEALSRQILTRARNISFDALQLYNMATIERNKYSVRLHASVLAFFLASLLISIGILVPINRSIASSVAKLISGSEAIGLGNLEHKIGLRTKDELGSLSRSFDAMTDSLRITTVSRDALVREVAQRKGVEEELRKAHEELELRVQERTEELRHTYEKLIKESEDRKQAEEQLRQSQKMEALGTLSGGIAHDFNNILAAIIGFTELVADHAVKGSQDEGYLARVVEAGVRGRDLVRQMLTFSRQTEQEKKPLRLSSIVEETIRLIRATTPTTIDIRVNVESESGMILGDPTQIQQVFMNLCTNAAYEMREKGGFLDVTVSDSDVTQPQGDTHGMKPGPYVKLAVRDTGAGIAPDVIEKIFDPFFTTKKFGEGTGLGLSVVHGIVKQHDGYITVESEPDRGSVFTVYFPKVPAVPETYVVSDDTLPTGSERILFVDDEHALVKIAEDILTGLGYKVTVRMNGREALALFRLDPSRFDLVITDQTMPEMTGLELPKRFSQ